MSALGLAPRIALYVSAALLLIILAFAVFSAAQSRATIEELMGARLESIAATAALAIDGTQHEALQQRADADSASYKSLAAALERVARANGVRPHLIYTLRPADAAFHFVLIGEPGRVDLGDRYLGAPPELGESLREGRPRHRGRYTTENGTWISGFAPIKDEQGRPVAVLEVDYEISEVLARAEGPWRLGLLAAGLIFLLGVGLVYASVKAATRRIERLTALADGISRGELGMSVPPMGADEVGRLAAALERLRESVRTSVELLAQGDDGPR